MIRAKIVFELYSQKKNYFYVFERYQESHILQKYHEIINPLHVSFY